MTQSDAATATAAASVRSLPPLVALADVAKFFHVTDRTVRRWIRSGALRASRTAMSGSGRVLVPRVEVVRFLATLNQPAAGVVE